MDRSRAQQVAIGAAAMLLSACSGSISAPNSNAPSSRIQYPDGSWGPVTGPGGINGPGAPGVNGPPGSAGTGPNGGNVTGSGGASGSDPASGALTCTTKAVGPSPMRRLTHTEYDNSVRDLLGTTMQPALEFAPDTQIGLFDNTASAQTIPELLADQYLSSAVSLAEGITDIDKFVGCDAAGADGTCVTGFVESFGRKAYRRPLTGDEVDGLVALYNTTTADSDSDTGVRGVVTAVLASPNFLFRPEFGADDSTLPDAKQLTPFELATRLSSLLWASTPDDTLLDAAAGGELATLDQVATQARRMLDDPKARSAVSAFYEQWLGLPLLASATKDAKVYPDWDDTLRASMAEETKRFIDHVLWEDDAKLSTLLSAPYTFVNAPLAKLYGVSGGKDADTYTMAMLDKAQRSGVLTQASLMTSFASPSGSSPIKRGKLVRVRLLCQDLPDPPANVPPPPAPEAGVSTRERFAMHTNSDACRGCHHLIDGLGFGLEHYDGIGAFRTMDQGVAVNSSGEINTTRDIDGMYDGGPELAALLATSVEVQDCAPTQWLRYAMARREDEDDTCSLVSLRDAFAASGGDLRELMVALTQTDAFWNYRQPE